MNKVQQEIVNEAFVRLFEGNATAAARRAGIRNPEVMGPRLLSRPDIKERIRKRAEEELKPGISRRQERQKFWSEIMNDPMIKMADRLKASELLGRSEADFTDNIKADLTAGLAEKMRAGRERVRRIGGNSEGSGGQEGGVASGE